MLTLPSHPAPLHTHFTENGYLPLPGLLTHEGLQALRDESARLEAAATRRDFDMECMADSPRHMTTLGGQHIAQDSELIGSLYRDTELLALLTALHGTHVLPVQEVVERHVLNILHHPGDTHGAHTDDYPLALVLFLEVPPGSADGGLLEFNPGRTDLTALGKPGTQQVYHHAGDAYLLRSDLTAHRVTPLSRPGTRRSVLNFAYTAKGHRAPVTESAERLYA
ncbi:hypothetical protein AB0N93_27835 [Streptomyces sp. NPDC091267]|uniref:HalD/BesD family halogenase n=1 Tax=unclassified Streptomyces TaxID=2593676 RepID=UPI003435AA8A